MNGQIGRNGPTAPRHAVVVLENVFVNAITLLLQMGGWSVQAPRKKRKFAMKNLVQVSKNWRRNNGACHTVFNLKILRPFKDIKRVFITWKTSRKVFKCGLNASLETIRRKLIAGHVIFTRTSTLFFFLYKVDGNWSEWKPWSSCPVTCGGGLETRIRTCTNPPAAFGGQSCPGVAEESRPCNEEPCPGNITMRKMFRHLYFHIV